jgi:uncharacterized membrane protein
MNKKLLFATIYLCADIAWITLMSDRFYNKRIARIQGNRPVRFRPFAAVGAYLLLLLTMFFVCAPLSRQYQGTTLAPPWAVFGLVGLCVYGVYNFTNYAVFVDYPVSFVLVDTLWGLLSFSAFGYLHQRMNAN